MHSTFRFFFSKNFTSHKNVLIIKIYTQFTHDANCEGTVSQSVHSRKIRSHIIYPLTIEEGKTKVEMFHQVCVSHHHVKHISCFGLNVTANHHKLSVGQHYSHFSLRRTRASLSGLWWTNTNKQTHMDIEKTTNMLLHKYTNTVHATIQTDTSERKQEKTSPNSVKEQQFTFQEEMNINHEFTTIDPGSSRTI